MARPTGRKWAECITLAAGIASVAASYFVFEGSTALVLGATGAVVSAAATYVGSRRLILRLADAAERIE